MVTPDILVSVIIPTKNRCDLLRETLASVRAQTYQKWEVIVVDDGSTDGTDEMVGALAATEKRIRFLCRERNPPGAPTCRNIGLERAMGKYVLFLDSDDLLAPRCLELRVNMLEAEAALMYVIGHAEWFYVTPGDIGVEFGDGEEKYDLERSICMHYPWQTAGPLWRRSIFDELEAWDEALLIGQDVDLGARALVLGYPYRRLHVRDYYCRANTNGLGSNNEKLDRQASHIRRIKRLHELLKKRNLLQGRITAMMAGNYLWVAQNLASLGHLDKADEIWQVARNERLAGTCPYWSGWLLLRAQRHRVTKLFAPAAFLFLPRGYLTRPEFSLMSPRFMDRFQHYRPVHCPRDADEVMKNGEFDYWFWIKYLLRPLKPYLINIIETKNKDKIST